MSFKIHYFPVPGRAEIARLCLSIGGKPYEDVLYTQATFPEAKSKMPFGQMPVLEFPDGTMLAQSGAIDRYCAKIGGLYPGDPLDAAHADQAVFLLNDFMELIYPSFRLPEGERAKARQEVLASEKCKEKLQQLNKLVEGGGYVAGSKLSFGDLGLFVGLSSMISGQFDGVPKTLLDEYPALKSYRSKIASEPGVKAYYDKKGEGIRAAFKPDA